MKEEVYMARPFVKWVGGKKQLLKDIDSLLQSDLSERKGLTYVEPFVGGGAVLFHLLQRYSNIERAVINDINKELICTYRVVKSDVDSLIESLGRLQTEYISLDTVSRKRYFLEKRDIFNKKGLSDIDTASLFIFLNKTCFNGLYRVNSKGVFNVPHGRYKNPKICDEDTLRADSKVLQRVEILQGDFEGTERYAGENTLFYIDSPYRPLTKTSAFTSYTKNGFDDSEHVRLKDFCTRISDKGATFIASNSDPKNIDTEDTFFDDLYKDFSIRRVLAARSINSDGSRRGPIREILISNL